MSMLGEAVEFVCEECGISCVKNRLDRWFHTDSIPANIDFHDPVVITISAWRQKQATPGFVSLADAARDMLTHHVAGHPESSCAFAKQLREALSR